jgi:hypothetical protein
MSFLFCYFIKPFQFETTAFIAIDYFLQSMLWLDIHLNGYQFAKLIYFSSKQIMKLLHNIGVEYISTVKLKADCNNF